MMLELRTLTKAKLFAMLKGVGSIDSELPVTASGHIQGIT